MSSYELSEWMAYERLSGPLGGYRGDIQAATISAAIVNALTVRGRRSKISDYLIPYHRAVRSGARQTGHEILRKVRGITRALGGELPDDDEGR